MSVPTPPETLLRAQKYAAMGYTPAQIAPILRMTAGTVSKLLCRGIGYNASERRNAVEKERRAARAAEVEAHWQATAPEARARLRGSPDVDLNALSAELGVSVQRLRALRREMQKPV